MVSSDSNILVSVGIPVVKATYLFNTIQCCINQTYKEIEIIVVNNAADKTVGDNIEKIVNSIDDRRIKYYRNAQQLPMIQNWNLTFKYATGSFFSILCDDDTWHPGFISTMINLSGKYPKVNLFHSRVLITNENPHEESLLSPLCHEYEDSLDFIYHRIKSLRIQYLSDFLVRSASLAKIGGFFDLPDGWGSDDITWYKVALTGEGVAYSDNPLFIYNNNTENVTNSKKLENKFKSLQAYISEVKLLIGNFSAKSDIDIIKNNMILSELPNCYKRSYMSLFEKRIKSYRFMPPLLMPLARTYIKVKNNLFGW
ncbi:MAG: glycosyltransferase family 2 protein [Salinivirgaceae bacterium]|nr:glycosyltransferase family 2 protein [Salinivirgaceae bacterium]